MVEVQQIFLRWLIINIVLHIITLERVQNASLCDCSVECFAIYIFKMRFRVIFQHRDFVAFELHLVL